MDVALVRGPVIAPRGGFNNEPCPPLGLAYLAGALKEAGHSVQGIDAAGEAIDLIRELPGGRLQANGLNPDEIAAKISPGTRVIGVSSMFSHEWPQDRALIRRLRRSFPEALIVAGGEHASALPEFSLKDCPELDCVALGEGEGTIVELCARAAEGAGVAGLPGLAWREGGAVRRGPPRARLRELDRIAWPDWSPFPLEAYLERGIGMGAGLGRSMPMLASRGCPYECTFCSSPAMWTTRWSARSCDDVLDEIEHWRKRYGITGVQFYDLTAIVKREWIVEFCEKLLARGLKLDWSLPSGTRSEALDAAVVGLLARTGCRYLVYAPESGSQETLRKIKKRIHLDRLVASVRAAVSRGIPVRANLILGFPHETREDIRETLKLQLRFAWLGAEDCPTYPFQPYPGSELFEDLRARGKIEVGDAYFDALASLSTGRFGLPDASYCEAVGPRELHFYRVTGFFLFYALSYLLRPLRVLRTAANLLFKGRTSSVFEQRLKDRLRRAALLLAVFFCCLPAAEAARRGRGVSWIALPGGEFTMTERLPDGLRSRKVAVGSFEIAKTEVTNREYRYCVRAGACPELPKSVPKQNCGQPGFDGDDEPVACVTWQEAALYSKWAGGRLPTRAEWVYAQRGGGKDRPYPWGSEPPGCSRAVVNAPDAGDGCGRRSPWNVCSKPAGNTVQGVCDMAGNVDEWLADEGPRGEHYYAGGSWCGSTTWANPDAVRSEGPDFRDDAVGFRPVRDRR